MKRFDLRLDGKFLFDAEEIAADPVLGLASRMSGVKDDGVIEFSAASVEEAAEKILGEFIYSPGGGARSLCGRYEIVPEKKW